MLDNYTLIDGVNTLPKPGDFICKEHINSLDNEEFIESLVCEVLSISRVDIKTGYPTFRTKQIPSGEILDHHRIVGSIFGEYYIINDKSKRNHKINYLLDD